MGKPPARRIDYLIGAAQVLARSEYVGSVSAERSQRGPRRDRNRRRLRDDQRTAGIENWRRWDIWRGRDLRGRHSDRQRNSRERKTANACEKHAVILTGCAGASGAAEASSLRFRDLFV